MAKKTPWAVLLCKWNDQNAEPRPRSFFEKLFTPAGAGTRNMVEFFDHMSHGNLDLTGSQVFGWFTLPQSLSAYVGNATPSTGQVDRGALVDLAKRTAAGQGVDLNAFYGVVVCMNVLTDLFGILGGRAVVCDPGSFRPTALGQEMAHGYGLDHSRREGSTEDYQDPWDIMSTWNTCHIAPDSNYTEIGPGMNAANMRRLGWLDESRVWSSTSQGFSEEVVELRPLHRRDLPGLLAAELPGGTLIEFRTTAGWDAAIPRAAILMHYFWDNHSYLLGSKDANDFVEGSVFEYGDSSNVSHRPYKRVEVVNINPEEQRATIRVSYRPIVFPDTIWPWPRSLRPRPRPPIERFIEEIVRLVDLGSQFGIDGDIGLPIKEPTFRILKQLVAYRAADLVLDASVRDTVRRSALNEIVTYAESALAELEQFKSPAPHTREAESGRARGAGKRSHGGAGKARPRIRK